MELNKSAWRRCRSLIARASLLRVAVMREESGAQVIDCGVAATGGLEAGRALAEVCMAGLGRVDFVPGWPELWSGLAVTVVTDQPVAACMASQYAGWRVAGERFYAMGSGPMRAVRGREPLYDRVGYREQASHVVGVLESGKLPPAPVCSHIAAECGMEPDDLTLLVAATSSQAGTVQVVARSVETALHKLLELGFDITRVESGYGVAPLPPVAADDLAALGRTNDAVLYGGEVTLWVRGDDESLEEIGPQLPSSVSPEHGQPFLTIFEKYEQDFYKIDPLLFSPAVVTLINLDSGRTHRFGYTEPDVIRESFEG